MKPVIIIAIAFVLLVPATAYGAEGYFIEDYGKQIYQSPTVCLIQPNDPRVTEQKWNIWYSDMSAAIHTWSSVLEQSGSGNWKITTVNVPLDKLELLNYSECDIIVNFVEKPNEDYKNYFGIAYIGNELIEIIYLDSYVCGNKYNSEFDIFVNIYCITNNMNRSKQMANTLQHEFGHMIGLGHYRGYEQNTTQEWYDGRKGSPSIMAWIEPNEEMRQISQIDSSKIREIYDYQGFGKKISTIPIFNEPYIPEPIIPVSGLTTIIVNENSQIIDTISGNVPDKLYKRGIYLEIVIQKPDGTIEYKATSVSKTLKSYKYPLIFDYSSSQSGMYEITLKFDGEIFEKIPINLIKKSSAPNVYTNFLDKTIGIVQWLETAYPVSGTGVVRIIDPDMNFNPEEKDSFDVDVWSDSDPRGIELVVTETRKSTGIFEGTVFFITTDESSSPRLRVAEGDSVTVEYEDRTLPDPHKITDELDITATTHMVDDFYWENISFTNPRVVDAFGNVLTHVEVNQQVNIVADIINNNNFSQDFAIQIIVRETGYESWITGSLSPDQSFTPTLTWIPTYSGTFTIDTNVFGNIEIKNKLSESLTIQITVEEVEKMQTQTCFLFWCW